MIWSSIQALFFLISAGRVPITCDFRECGNTPRKMAKTAKPMKGEYKYNSFSDAFPDPTSSDNIAT